MTREDLVRMLRALGYLPGGSGPLYDFAADVLDDPVDVAREFTIAPYERIAADTVRSGVPFSMDPAVEPDYWSGRGMQPDPGYRREGLEDESYLYFDPDDYDAEGRRALPAMLDIGVASLGPLAADDLAAGVGAGGRRAVGAFFAPDFPDLPRAAGREIERGLPRDIPLGEPIQLPARPTGLRGEAAAPPDHAQMRPWDRLLPEDLPPLPHENPVLRGQLAFGEQGPELARSGGGWWQDPVTGQVRGFDQARPTRAWPRAEPARSRAMVETPLEPPVWPIEPQRSRAAAAGLGAGVLAVPFLAADTQREEPYQGPPWEPPEGYPYEPTPVTTTYGGPGIPPEAQPSPFAPSRLPPYGGVETSAGARYGVDLPDVPADSTWPWIMPSGNAGIGDADEAAPLASPDPRFLPPVVIDDEAERRELQYRLQQRGLYDGPIDAIIGPDSQGGIDAVYGEYGAPAPTDYGPDVLSDAYRGVIGLPGDDASLGTIQELLARDPEIGAMLVPEGVDPQRGIDNIYGDRSRTAIRAATGKDYGPTLTQAERDEILYRYIYGNTRYQSQSRSRQ